ncbi:MAG TPA: pyruvate kinase [Bdellovibrionota bacterium]|nr:pyruvate kinase [Bdellovibrionota bacterium]
MRYPHRKAKIVCTIGPAVLSEDAIAKLIQSGMDVARVNFSHGTKTQHAQTIKWIRSASEKLNIPVGVLADIQGPKIRTGVILAENGEPGILNLQPGVKLHFTGADVRSPLRGNGQLNSPISISYPNLLRDLNVGDDLLFDDGLVKFQIIEKNVRDGWIKAEAVFGQALSSNKGVNMPTAKLSALGVTEKDWEDIQFCIENDVDFIALSFVRTAKEVKNIRNFLDQKGCSIHLIAKIEKAEAIENLEEIMAHVSGLMVARGDLGVEIGNENVPVAQKKIIQMARRMGKPVITATQMLMSMVSQPSPSRAEASDVANAVWDGSDALMLSNETASGSYPFEAVKAMDAIIKGAEAWRAQKPATDNPTSGTVSPADAIESAAVTLSQNLKAQCLACLTRSGQSARHLSKYRPNAPIFAFAENATVRRQLTLAWGISVVPWREITQQDYTLFDDMKDEMVRLSILSPGGHCVITAGIPTSRQVGTTNTVVVRRG